MTFTRELAINLLKTAGTGQALLDTLDMIANEMAEEGTN